MLSRTISYTTLGLEAIPVEVEVDVTQGLPALTIVGLPDQAVKESRDRVRAAIINSQYRLPSQKVTVNLAPADIKKQGGAHDLAIALGILATTGQVDPAKLAQSIVLGELALDGSVRSVPGILSVAMALRGERKQFLIPAKNANEACAVEGLNVIAIRTLGQAVAHLSEDADAITTPSTRTPPLPASNPSYDIDFSDVKGQAYAKRALEVAVAGGHHVLLIGPPGSGKSMLAQRIPTISPHLSTNEALEVTAIHSIVGLLNGKTLLQQRPFRAPHHTSSAVALIGGGSFPKPGEVSLAHHGVLFLDELPEFHRNVLESLRQPLEDGMVRIARAKRSLSFPAKVMLVAAMNPCPCGYLTDPKRSCRCNTLQIQRYLAKISGPLLDRIDLHIDVPAVPYEALRQKSEGETSKQIRRRILKARLRQQKYLVKLKRSCNAQLRHRDLKSICPLTTKAGDLLKAAMEELSLSARSYDKLLKVARTIADLADETIIQPEHLAEAIQYRSLDRQLWM